MNEEPLPNRDQTLLESGQVLSHHGASQCRPPCCLHGTATAAACKLPRQWRSDRGILEHVCEHGVGHPHPWAGSDSIHGCDGCCAEPEPDELEAEFQWWSENFER